MKKHESYEVSVPDNYWEDEAAKIVELGLYDTAVQLMDDDLREAVHADLAPCGDAEFLAEYMRRHFDKYGKEFTV